MAKKNQEFYVTFRVLVETAVPITAESFEDAIEKGKTYEVRDIVEFDTDFNDGNIEVLGVFKHNV